MTEIKGAKWRKGFRANVPASVVIVEVEALHQELGIVRPSDVVHRARDKRSPLHPQFEWNDSVAAERHREDQARRLLRNLVIVMEDGDQEKMVSPAYVSVVMSDEEGADRGYVRISEALNDEDLRERALADAIKLLNGLRRRYAAIERLVEILDGVELQLKKELAA